MQTTSVNPREEHREFWANNLTLPIDDPFWDKHRPGDQWNCKCWLEQTDAPRTALEDMPDSADIPEPKAGLRGNTAKTKEIFSQDHPHFPNKCASCHLNTDGKVHGIKGKKNPKNSDVLKGNCHLCEMSNSCEARLDKKVFKTEKKFVVEKEFDNGGKILISELVCRKDSDFYKLYQIAEYFASNGSVVELTPKMSRPERFKYETYYKSLLTYLNGKYNGKCPDLRIDGKWYEHEGYITTNPKRALSNMLNDGLKQSDHLILDAPNLTEGYIKKILWFRTHNEGQEIKEIWLRDDKKVWKFYPYD